MNRKYIKSLLCLLTVCMLLLSSCGIITVNTKEPQKTTSAPETTKAPETETDPPETVESAAPPAIIPEPEKWEIRYNEAAEMLKDQTDLPFDEKILFIVDSAGTFSAPLIQNNIYSEATYERYQMLEEKYGMTVSVAPAERELLYDDYIKTIKGGNTFSDLLSVPLRDTAKFIQSGYIQNLRSLPFFKAKGDFSIPSFEASRAAYDDVWFSVGYATLSPSDLGCLYFNRTIASNAELDLYSTVENGEFTIEKYLEILTLTNGSAVWKEGSDVYLTALELSDEKFFETGYGKEISLSSTVFSNAMSSVTDILSVLTKSNIQTSDEKTASALFEEGNVLFRFGTLDEITSISELKMFFGVLPMPKTDVEAEYKTPVSDMTAALMITSNTAQPEMCSITVSAINAASYKWLLDSVGLHYANYHIPDIKSARMIRIITENPVLDFSASARHLTPWYDVMIHEPMKKKLDDPTTDLSALFTAANLRSLKSELNKYYK